MEGKNNYFYFTSSYLTYPRGNSMLSQGLTESTCLQLKLNLKVPALVALIT